MRKKIRAVYDFFRSTFWAAGVAGWFCILYSICKDRSFFWGWLFCMIAASGSLSMVRLWLDLPPEQEIVNTSLRSFKPSDFLRWKPWAAIAAWIFLFSLFVAALPPYWSELFPFIGLIVVGWWRMIEQGKIIKADKKLKALFRKNFLLYRRV